ncbi:sugar ABC transporter substrate-binding protein [Salipaludibacillus sp. CF4.18]|uniref:sugar ABC transporter substrate-binding protein n=1 Tax=Salipaludibacillus sp. CF4.18 TaxID=3373081 RepID=UPI003EE802D3
MMVNKNVFSLILSLVMVFMLAACGEGEGTSSEAESSSGDKKVIGVSLSSVSDTFRTFIYDAMNKEAANHPDFEFVFSDAQDDSSKQMNQVENFITRNVDAIIFMPVDTVAAPDILNRVNEVEIPIIVVNQTFEEVDQATAFVGSSSLEAGLMQMEEVAKQLEGNGNVAIIDGTLGHEAQIKRTEGNMQILDEHPDMEVVLQSTAEWSRNEGMNLMENWLQAGQQIDAVVANNDEMAIGALLAIEAAGKLDEITVAGIDATPDALDLMKSGKLDVTVFQDAKGQATTSVQLAVKAANKEEVETVMIPFQLVNQENVDEFIEDN